MKYFLYVRKSSESEDRQVQSLDDQINHLTGLAKKNGLDVVKTFKESKSAKAPNQRPMYMKMLKEIEEGNADGILCWQINRLSRNSVDSGQLQWFLQNNIIKSIQTFDKEYKPEDNVLLFSVESGMANQYILDLRKNVKRGMQSKLDKGVLPGHAPQGYINDRLEHTIIEDTERFSLIKKIWKMMLSGSYTPPQIAKIANEEWGYRTRQTKRKGGTPLSRSGIYALFTNPFYCGIIKWNDDEYQGSHKAMISLEEYERVQELLGKKGNPRSKKYEFAYRGIIRCGECGCMITAEHKRKYRRLTEETKTYTYYHCTKRKKDVKCSQKTIRKSELEKQINKQLKQIKILPEFREWALEILRRENKNETCDREQIYKNINQSLEETQKQIDKLTDLLLKDLINEDEFKKKKSELQKNLMKLKSERDRTEDRAEHWLDLSEKAFNFATYAIYNFNKGSLQAKKEIFSALGENFILKDRKVSLELDEWLIPIQQGYAEIEREYLALEPNERSIEQLKKDPSGSIYSKWWAIEDSNL